MVVSSGSRVRGESSSADCHYTVRLVKLTFGSFCHNHGNPKITGISKSAEVKGSRVCFQSPNES